MLYFSGIQLFAERKCSFEKAFVLMYHRVLPSADNQPYYVQPGMYVTTASFDKQLSYLKKRFKVVFLEDLVEKIHRKENIGGLCAITFDDGWRDNFTEAFPVLIKHQVPSTIFLSTGFVGTDRIFWPEELCFYLNGYAVNKSAPDGSPPAFARFHEEIGRYFQGKREKLFDRSIEILKGYSVNDRNEILGYFRSRLFAAPAPRQMLSWDEIRAMLTSGLVRYGSHTVNHEILDQVSQQEAEEEILKSQKEIENRLGVVPGLFAYPNGNFTPELKAILKRHGYKGAVITRKDMVGNGSDQFEIPRIGVHEDVSCTIPLFGARTLFKKF